MKNRTFDAKKASLVFLLAFLIAQIVLSVWQTILKYILALFDYHDASNYTQNPFLYLVFAIGQLAVFVAIFVICYKRYNLKDSMKQEKLSAKWLTIFVCLGVVTMFALSYFVNYFTTVLNLLGRPSSSLPYAIDNWSSYLCSLVSLAIFPAIGEELLFRATIFNGLKSKGKLYAIVMSSVMFAIFHFSLDQLYYPLLFGMLLGIAYAYTDNIIIPMSMHFVNNALNITLQFISSTQTSQNSILFTVIGIIIYLGILSYGLYLVHKKEETNVATLKAPKPQEYQAKSTQSSVARSERLQIALPIALMVCLYLILIFV